MARLSNGTMAGLTRAAVLSILLVAAACGSDGDSSDTSDEVDPSAPAAADESSADSGNDTGGAPDESGAGADAVADAPVLQPFAVITPDQPGGTNSVAVSPDGTLVALSSQEALGMPATIGLYDVATGQQVATAEADVDRLGLLHWMADNRLVAAANALDSEWLSWDGTTLAELPSVPLDPTCAEGRADKNTGAIYSSDGLTSMGDTLCRVDTLDGSVVRTTGDVLVRPDRFWVLPSTSEIAVLHSPDPDNAQELVRLDGATLTPNSAIVVEFTETVREVSQTVWFGGSAFEARLEPGAIALPPLTARSVSGAGTMFIAFNDSDGVVFVSATDGTVIGTIAAAVNLAFSDWSLDDSVFARATADNQIEVYSF